jgi:probable F420-dependent oxidoreductase
MNAGSAPAKRALDLGVLVQAEAKYGFTPQRLVDLARELERCGFHSIWFGESWGNDAVSLVTYLAARTERIVIGTALLNVYSRSPATLAMTAATLAELFPRRIIFGLGTSTRALVEEWHGIAFEQPARRLAATLEIVRRLLAGGQVGSSAADALGGGYRLRGGPPDVPPPLFVAGLGPATVRVVAEHADGWLPYLLPRSAMADAVASLRTQAQQAGRDPTGVSVAALIPAHVSDTSLATGGTGHIRCHLALYLGAMGPHYRAFVANHGYGREAELVARRWQAGDRTAAQAAISDDMLADLAVVGGRAEVRAGLADCVTRGVDLPILVPPRGLSFESIAAAYGPLPRHLAAGTNSPPTTKGTDR